MGHKIKKPITEFWVRAQRFSLIEELRQSGISEALNLTLTSNPKWRFHAPTEAEYMTALVQSYSELLLKGVPPEKRPADCLLCGAKAVEHDVYVAMDLSSPGLTASTLYGLCAECFGKPDKQQLVSAAYARKD